jgi:hypothetical protein
MRCFNLSLLTFERHDCFERDPNPIISSPSNAARLPKAIAFDYQIEVIWNSERT